MDPLGLCNDPSSGVFLVPGPCDFRSRAWVAAAEGYLQVQKTQEMEGGWAKFWGGIEDFGDMLTANPLAYCGPGSSEEAGLANVLDLGSGLAGGDPELDAEGEGDVVPAVSGETAATAYGRAAHAAYDYGPGFVKEWTLENGKRADAVNFATREVIELKPNNTRAIAEGLRQAQGYAQQLTQEFPGAPFTYRVVTYDRP